VLLSLRILLQAPYFTTSSIVSDTLLYFALYLSSHYYHDSHQGCTCPAGFVGPVCEFKDLDMEPVTTCNLPCHNHGICRKGAKDLSVLKQFGLLDRRHLQSSLSPASYNHDFEHCVCPTGYVGLQCEYELDLCPGGQHACFHGGQCKPTLTGGDKSKVSFTCDCEGASSLKSRFEGEFCEMESTQFCTVDGRKTRGGISRDAFCTNGGACRDLVEHGAPYVAKKKRSVLYIRVREVASR
jgi:hypothetical protein